MRDSDIIKQVEDVTGYSVKRWPICKDTTTSMTVPYLKTIYLAKHVWDGPNFLAVLGHEADHACRQYLDPFYLFKYLFKPSYRLSDEISGEAVETAVRAILNRVPWDFEGLLSCVSTSLGTGRYCLKMTNDEKTELHKTIANEALKKRAHWYLRLL